MLRHRGEAETHLDGFAKRMAQENMHLLDARGYVGRHDQHWVG